MSGVTRASFLTLLLVSLLPPTLASAHGQSGRPPGAGQSGGGSGRSGGAGSSSGKGRIVPVLPDGSLRDLCTSFTQVTESPFTLEAGRLEASLDIVSASTAKLDTIRSRAWDTGALGIARGLPGRWAVGASLDTWAGVNMVTGPTTGEVNPAGFSGGALAVRHTLAGKEGDGAAIGLVAVVHFPGASSSPLALATTASLAAPIAGALPLDVSLGEMTQVLSLPDENATGRHLRFVESLKLERSVVERVSCWVELLAIRDQERGHSLLGAANAGLAIAPLPHVSASVGASVGHSPGATDHGFFCGLGLSR